MRGISLIGIFIIRVTKKEVSATQRKHSTNMLRKIDILAQAT